MKRPSIRSIIPAIATLLALAAAVPAAAQTNRPRLHVSPRWRECSLQLDPSLSQTAWHQFTEEAGLVTYFRPLSDARPMGKGTFEASVLQWQTGIDNSTSAWNDTFVHPDSTHWLFEGNRLAFPGLMIRSGLTATTDVAAYVTKNPGSNYGFYGAQVQRALTSGNSEWHAAARASFVSLYGPADLDFTVYGADLVASRTVAVTRWASLSPYVETSGYFARSHAKSSAVNLTDEQVPGMQGSFGAALDLSAARLAVEYNVARVRSISMKIGVGL